jgi:hypothetical protein
LPFFGIGGLPAANSNCPPVADSNGNSGIPAAALQAQKRRFPAESAIVFRNVKLLDLV